jgi:hypothetical protein
MQTRSVSRSTITDRRRVLTATAILLGIGEFGDSFFISFWEGAAVFCVLFLAGALWTRRGGIGGPILIGVLCAFEIQGFLSWQRGGTADWISQIAFLVGSIAGVLVVLAVLKRAFDTRKTKQHVAQVEV